MKKKISVLAAVLLAFGLLFSLVDFYNKCYNSST
jgi:hypothetical protein